MRGQAVAGGRHSTSQHTDTDTGTEGRQQEGRGLVIPNNRSIEKGTVNPQKGLRVVPTPRVV